MSEHFTLRLPAGTTDRIRHRADRVGTPPRTLAQRYIEEGLRQDDHPLIRFVGEPGDRRAALQGRGLEVWELVGVLRANGNDARETAEYLDLRVALVEAAVSYYGEFPEEIDRTIAENDAEWERGYAAWQAARQALSS